MMKFFLSMPIVGLLAVIVVAGCSASKDVQDGALKNNPSLTKQAFGKTLAGEDVTLYTLTNARGMSASIIDYGAILVSLKVPDKRGMFDDVVIGYNNMDDYQKRSHNFGATIGRVAGRINKGRFTLDGQTYELPKNLEATHTVHGGPVGFDKLMWTLVKASVSHKTPALTLRYLSRDGDMGFPGNLQVEVTYSLTEENGLRMDYRAVTDKPTPVNFTHHGYFNLKGEGNGDVLDHQLQIDATHTLATVNLVHTGQLENIAGSILDFNSPRRIGDHIRDPQLELRRGYNHFYTFDHWTGKLARVASLSEDQSGRKMEVWTTEPGMQLYAGNMLNGQFIGKSGRPYAQYAGVCLEAQHYPDSPNQPQFPNTILRPGEHFHSTTIYKFGLQK